jgi:hypothetical protein
VSNAVVRGDQALLSWSSGKTRGVMGMVNSADRWWDALDLTANDPNSCWNAQTAYPIEGVKDLDKFRDDARIHPPAPCAAASVPPAAGVRVNPSGGAIHPLLRKSTSGYDIAIAYTPNDAGADVKLTQLFARAPTHAEFAPSNPPAPGFGGADAVCFFDVGIGASKPVTFQPGTAVDIWFPFVLDDRLRYNLSFVSAGKPSGMIFGTVFDNTLHFVLPAFTIDAREPLMAEIDGDPKGSS